MLGEHIPLEFDFLGVLIDLSVHLRLTKIRIRETCLA